MRELYDYMGKARKQMYASGEQSVTIDSAHFFRLYQAVCYMQQIKSIVNFDDDMEQMLSSMRRDQDG